MEEFGAFSGLSPTQIENIIKYGNYRKNRRFLMQVLVSMLLRLDDVCREEGGTEFSNLLNALLREDIASDVRRARGEETDEDRKRRADALKDVLPDGCELEISESISPELIKAGKMFCDEIESLGEHSLNMKYFGECGMLNALLPWSAYNILARRGQSKILDRFWFKFAGLIHGTGKLSYQENMLWYMLVKKIMPQVAYEILYDEGHILMSMSDLPGTNLHLDEALEMGIIRHTKMLNTCIAEILERSPAFTMLAGRHRDTIERELDPSRRRNTRNADLKLPTKASNEEGFIRIDGEKRTAVNVAEMYSFLSRKGWLNKEHLHNQHLANVLRGGDEKFDPFFLRSTEIGKRLLDAEKNGKLYAGLHLCCKLEDIFGELSDDDIVRHFNGKAPGSGKWTLAFKFRSMRDMDPSRNQPSKGTKRSRSEKTEWKRYISNQQVINNIKERLTKVLRFSTPERRRDAGILLDEVETKEHVLVEKSFAFRKTLLDDTPNFESGSKFWIQLQDSLMTSPSVTEEDYFFDGPGPFVPNVSFSSLHFDVTEWTRHAPSLSLEDLGIGSAIYDKFKRDLRKYARSEKYRGALDIHFHVDVDVFMPRQRMKRPDLSIDDLGLLAAEEEDRDEPSHQDKNAVYADFSTPLEGNLSSFNKNRGNRTFLSMLHAVMAGKAMSDLIEEERAPGFGQSIQYHSYIFLHGVAITITEAARDTALAELKFSRIGSTILVSKNCPSEDILIKTRHFLEAAQSYPPSCCWSVSQAGLQRFGGGDCQHAESQTRIVRSILTVTVPRFRLLRIKEKDRTVLVISKSKGLDGPMIVSRVPALRNLFLVYRIKETSVEITKLRNAIRKVGISEEHLLLLYAMGGCGTLPSTQKVSHLAYFKAFIHNRSAIGNLRDGEGGFDLRNFKDATWDSFERLVAAAYVEAFGKNYISVTAQDAHDKGWAQSVRTRISKLPNSGTPAALMPASADIELQTRRALWLLRYWSHADDVQCDQDTALGLCIEWGFTKTGQPVLESPEELEIRKKVLKSIISSCRCKSGCNTQRCSCFKDPDSRLCILCECENCQNRGTVTRKELKALADSVGRLQVEGAADNADEGDELVDSDSDSGESLVNSLLGIEEQDEELQDEAVDDEMTGATNG